MGVKIDDSRRHGETAGIEHFVRRIIDPADGGNASVVHPDVGVERRHAGAVIDAPAFQNQIIHNISFEAFILLRPATANSVWLRFHS